MSEQKSNHLAASMNNWVAGNMLKNTCLAEIALAAGEGDMAATNALKLAEQSHETRQNSATLDVTCAMGECGIRLIMEGALIQPVNCTSHGTTL